MSRVVQVPIVALTEDTVLGYGTLIHSLAEAELRFGKLVEQPIEVQRRGDEFFFVDHATKDTDLVGPIVAGAVLVGQVNYHADAGQAFISRNRRPTLFLLHKPSSGAPLAEDFVALYSDGSVGICMDPEVWHDPHQL